MNELIADLEKQLLAATSQRDYYVTCVLEYNAKMKDLKTTIAVMKALSGQSELDFAEGDKTVKKAPLAMFQERLKAGPKVIEFGEVATKDKSQAPKPDDKLTALTKAKMDANKGMNYAEASRLVLAENPALNISLDAE